MVHLDLFSGIGGFSFAADQVWDDVEHIFCEWDSFCQQVIKKHWSDSLVYGDIKTITDTRCKHGESWSSQRTQRQTPQWCCTAKEIERLGGVDLLTGGFPCQPFSAAGVRRGTSDERYLWPQMFRVIQLAQPTWVIAENVRGLLTWEQGVVFEQVCSDLESAGYEVQPFIIPAIAVNAPHRRDRIWFVAHSNGSGRNRQGRRIVGEKTKVETSNRAQDSIAKQSAGADNRLRKDRLDDKHNSDPNSQRLQTSGTEQQPAGFRRKAQNNSNSERQGWARGSSENTRRPRQSGRNGGDQRRNWNKNWLEVATEFCSVDDGVPIELDGLKLSKSRHRAEQLKAYGNAIVPQVAIEIMKGIRASDENG